jgi:antirestriction protein ArdC
MFEAINAITREPYSGKNQLTLQAYALANGYEPLFLTFRQALSINRCVRKGEHGCAILKIVESEKIDPTTGKKKKGPRGYTVFALAQTDPLPATAETEGVAS